MVESEVDVITAHELHGPEGLRMVVGQYHLAVEGGGHRHPEGFGEVGEGLRSSGSGGAVARRQRDGVFGLPQDPDRPFDLLGRWFVRTGGVDGQEAGGRRERCRFDVFGNGRKRKTAPGRSVWASLKALRNISGTAPPRAWRSVPTIWSPGRTWRPGRPPHRIPRSSDRCQTWAERAISGVEIGGGIGGAEKQVDRSEPGRAERAPACPVRRP